MRCAVKFQLSLREISTTEIQEVGERSSKVTRIVDRNENRFVARDEGCSGINPGSSDWIVKF